MWLVDSLLRRPAAASPRPSPPPGKVLQEGPQPWGARRAWHSLLMLCKQASGAQPGSSSSVLVLKLLGVVTILQTRGSVAELG